MKPKELVRGLDLGATTALVVGTIIGTGVFLKAAKMSQAVGTPALVLLAWAVAGLLSLAGALSYAELGAMLPAAGGEYVYLRTAYGRLPAFLFGWMRLAVGSTGSIASAGAGFATFLAALVPLDHVWAQRTFHFLGQQVDWQLGGRQIAAVAVILFFAAINCLRVAFGGSVQLFLTIAKVLGIAAIVVGAFFFAPTATWAHLHSPSGAPAWSGFSAFGAAMLAALWAYDGWNNMPMAAGEVRNPGRNIPLALIAGTLAVLAIYAVVNVAYFYALPISEIASSSSTLHGTALPVAGKAAETFLPGFGARVVAVAAILSIIGSLNGSILTGARVTFAMARDGFLSSRFARLNARAAVPAAAILLEALWACALALSATFDQLTDCVIFAEFIFYALTTTAVLVLRKKRPDLPRPYKTLGYPFTPVVFVLVAGWLVVNTLRTAPLESLAGLVLIALGLPIYFLRPKNQASDANA
jgi:APA family basic amino acid/polyamine antiporter